MPNPLAELVANPLYTFLIGLGLGLWVAVNCWIWRYAVGFKAAIKYCTDELEPVRVEIATLAGLRHVNEGLHHVSENLRQALKAAQEGETRH